MPGLSYDLPGATWRKSTKCDMSGPNCVEVLRVDDHISIRNSQRPDVTIGYDRDEWRAFVEGVKAGEFDI